MRQMIIHGAEGFEGMRKAGNLATESENKITLYVKLGVTTEEMDRI